MNTHTQTHRHTHACTHRKKEMERDTHSERTGDLYHGLVDCSEVDTTYFITISHTAYYFSILKLENFSSKYIL